MDNDATRYTSNQWSEESGWWTLIRQVSHSWEIYWQQVNNMPEMPKQAAQNPWSVFVESTLKVIIAHTRKYVAFSAVTETAVRYSERNKSSKMKWREESSSSREAIRGRYKRNRTMIMKNMSHCKQATSLKGSNRKFYLSAYEHWRAVDIKIALNYDARQGRRVT